MPEQVSIAHPLDGITLSVNTIAHEHHEIHEGDSFTVSDVQLVDATTFKWQITTSNSERVSHMIFDIDCTGEMLVLITEGSDRTDGGGLTEINRNRNCDVVSSTVVTTTPTDGATDGAVTIDTLRVGSTGVASKTISSGGARGQNEYMLKQNTKYVVSVTTFATVYVTLHLDWYEHIEGVC